MFLKLDMCYQYNWNIRYVELEYKKKPYKKTNIKIYLYWYSNM